MKSHMKRSGAVRLNVRGTDALFLMMYKNEHVDSTSYKLVATQDNAELRITSEK